MNKTIDTSSFGGLRNVVKVIRENFASGDLDDTPHLIRPRYSFARDPLSKSRNRDVADGLSHVFGGLAFSLDVGPELHEIEATHNVYLFQPQNV